MLYFISSKGNSILLLVLTHPSCASNLTSCCSGAGGVNSYLVCVHCATTPVNPKREGAGQQAARSPQARATEEAAATATVRVSNFQVRPP